MMGWLKRLIGCSAAPKKLRGEPRDWKGCIHAYHAVDGCDFDMCIGCGYKRDRRVSA